MVKKKDNINQGKIVAGSQIYRCKSCKKVYTPNPKRRGHSEEIKKQAIKLYLEGNSGRAVGRILGIGKTLCLYWIRKYAKTTKEKELSNERVDVIEMDELFSYTKEKKQNLRDNAGQ